MNKELFNDLGDMIGINMYGINDPTEICSVCEILKEHCLRLEVVSCSLGHRPVTLCPECFNLMWPKPKKE